MKQRMVGIRITLVVLMLGLLSGCHTLSDKEYVEVRKTPKQIQILEQNDFRLEQNIENLGKAVDQMRKDLQDHINNKDASVEKVGTDSARVTLQNKVLFGNGSTNLSREGKKVLADFAKNLGDDPSLQVKIVGHTDNLPPSARLRARYLDNWELSAVRAASVARYFVWERHIDPKRLTIVGKADNVPVASNATAKGRSQNRRVELFLTVSKKAK